MFTTCVGDEENKITSNNMLLCTRSYSKKIYVIL